MKELQLCTPKQLQILRKLGCGFDLNREIPSIAQALTWCRDEKGMNTNIAPEYYQDGINWCWQVSWYLIKDKWKLNNKTEHPHYSNVWGGSFSFGDNHEYPTYEDAERGCLTYILEKLLGQGFSKEFGDSTEDISEIAFTNNIK